MSSIPSILHNVPFRGVNHKEVEMVFIGDTRVITNMWRKKQLLTINDPQHKTLSPLLLLPGGGQRGVVPAGVAAALENLRLVDAFDTLVTSSTGAAIGLYMLAGDVKQGRTIYWEENVRNEFAKKRRVRKVLDIDTLEEEFRYGKKRVAIKAVFASRPKFYVSVTDEETGEGLFLDAKKCENPIDAVVASINVPILSGGKVVELHGKRFVDGDLGNPLPIDFAISQDATDILVVMSSPLDLYPKLPIKIIHMFQHTNYKHLSEGVLRKITSYTTRFNDALCYLRGEYPLPKGIRIAAIYPKIMPIGWFCMDAALLKEGSYTATTFAENFFLQYKPKKK